MASKKPPVRFAVLGAGHMGGKHIRKIYEIGEKIGAQVTVIVEPDEIRGVAVAREVQGRGPEPKVISNLGLLTSVPAEFFPEAAIVAVPASIHADTTLAALNKGLHCLVEKPLGFSALDCREMDAAANRAKKIIQVGLLERWAMAHMWGNWKPAVGPWTIHTVRNGPFVPRASDTDVIHDLLIHDLDLFVLLDSVFGLSPIKTIRARGTKLRSDHLDHVKVGFDLENGGFAHFFASRLAADSSRRWEMTGPGWHASIDMMRRTLRRFERVKGKTSSYFEAFETSWPLGDPLALEIETFVSRVRGTFRNSPEDTEDPIFSFWDSEKILPTPKSVLRTHELIDEILSCIKVLDF
jgi:predicted dehydrogenase